MVHSKTRLTFAHLKRSLKKNFVNSNGFTMLEAIVVVGVLLALAVGGFTSYGPITENAKFATVRSEASAIYTAAEVAQIDGDPFTTVRKVLDDYNQSTDKIRVLVRKGENSEFTATPPVSFDPEPDNDYCIRAERVGEERIFADTGSCFDTVGEIDPVVDPDPVTPTPSPSASPSPSPAPSTPAPPVPYVDPTPALTKLTYQCPTARTGAIPMNGTLTGTETWSDGVTVTYAGVANPTSRNLAAGVEYTVNFDGTYKFFNSGNLQGCLRSVDHWGDGSGAISGFSAFSGAALLTSVPDHIPPTVSGVEGMFSGATIFNDPNVSKWDMSNVTRTFQMFTNAKAFNQPLNDWNTNKFTDIGWMFYGASAFNQPLDKWNVIGVSNMTNTFNGASAFNQNINIWNVSNTTSMNGMFFGATSFDKPLNNWDVSKVVSLNGMFTNAKVFNQPLNNWNVSKATAMQGMFNDAKAFNQNIDSWNVSNVGNMSSMFMGASSFNQPLNSWNLAKVSTTTYMFNSATSFNQPLNNWLMTSVNDTQFMFQNATSFNQNINSWNVSNVTNMSSMFDKASAFNQPLDNWNTGNVVRFSSMFQNTASFNQNINTWNTSKVVQAAFMFRDAAVYNQPINNWDVSKMSNIGFMFYNANAFTQDLSSWNLAAITSESASTFVRVGFPTSFLPPKVT